MQLRSTERCEECTWGSTYADERMRLYAEYTSWNEEYAEQYLAKQPDYQKQITELGGKKAKVQSWRTEDSPGGAILWRQRKVSRAVVGFLQSAIRRRHS
jgi:hypothetical protein